MAGSSELSDALNPKYSTRRPHIGTQNAQNANGHPDSTYLPSPTLQQQHLSSNLNALSGLTTQQDVFVVSPLTPLTPDTSSGSPNGQSPVSRPSAVKQRQDPIQLLKNIMVSLADQKRTFELEKERRLAWEAQQETNVASSQAEFERRISSMQEEIDGLKSRLPPDSHDLDSDEHPGRQLLAHDDLPHNSFSLPTPTEIKQDIDQKATPSYPGETLQRVGSALSLEAASNPPVPEFVQGSSTSPSITCSGEQSRKRMRTKSPSQESVMPAPMKLRTRQSQPRSIQAAMRSHLLKCMDLDHDKNLPPSFKEGQILRDDEPVRFVWDLTTRKSVHNGNMKKRIVSDIMMNRVLYPLVPVHEFTKDKLEAVFEQAYTTFRTKFSSQSSANLNDKDDGKAQKARRQSRKKTKLANRLSTRKLLSEYSASFFDAAFQMDCMSSEESSEGEEDEEAGSDDDHPKGYLKIRCLAWRSSRLQKLYELVDEREEFERSQKPRRGIGRKDRRLGEPKDGNPLPPIGIFKWMVSKKWYRESQSHSTHVASLLQECVLEDGETAWMSLAPLGPESDYEDNPQPPMMMTSTTEFNNPYYGENHWTGGLGFVGMGNMLPP